MPMEGGLGPGRGAECLPPGDDSVSCGRPALDDGVQRLPWVQGPPKPLLLGGSCAEERGCAGRAAGWFETP